MTYLDHVPSSFAKLHPYTPGKPIEEVSRELGLNPKDIVKLASNENPIGPSPKAIAAANASLHDARLYPDGSYFDLKSALSEFYGVGGEQITVGNGSDSLLRMVAQVFTNPSKNIVMSEYAFITYSIVASAQGASVKVAKAANWGHDLDAMYHAIDEYTSVVFIANPNNPTGTWFDEQTLKSFLDKCPKHVIVVIDEAYFEYVTEPSYPNTLKLLSSYPNLIITRTFSKLYGLAGLRIGYAFAHLEVATLLNKVRLPFNVNIAGAAAAIPALVDEEHKIKTKHVNDVGLKRLENMARQYGLEYIPSIGNFLTIEFDDGKKFNQAFLEKGVIVRPLGVYNMPKHLRVSVGTEAELDHFESALDQLINP